MAYGAQHTLWLVPEVTWGTTPATPAFVPHPLTKISGGASMTTLVDPTIRGDRQIAYVRNGAIADKLEVGDVLRYGIYDALLEGACCGDWTTNVLKPGVSYHAFSGERHFADILDKPYFRHTGLEVSKLNLKVGKDSFVEATFSLMGQDENSAAAAITGATYGTVDTSNSPFDSFTCTITEGGSSIVVVQDFSIDIDNKLEEKRVVGSRLALRPAKLFSDVQGTVQVYFENAALFDKFKASTFTSMSLTLTDAAGNSLAISIPKLLFTGEANRDVSGPGTVSTSLKFQAILDPVTGTNLSITRTPHS